MNEIEHAIANRRLLIFIYKGALRTVEPHLMGINQKGNLCLSAFQIEGGSGQSWRAFLVNEMTQVQISQDGFSDPRDGYNPADSTMLRIICQI